MLFNGRLLGLHTRSRMNMKQRMLLSRIAAVVCCVRVCQAEPVPAESGDLLFRDDFKGKLAEGWSLEREDRSNWRVSPRGLEVRVQPGNMWGGANNARNVFVREIPDPADAPVEISVTISNQPTAQWEQANLVWYYDASNMVKLGQELVTGRYSIVMGREEGDRARTVAIIPLDAYTVELRLQAVGNRIRGQYRTPVSTLWRDAGECDLPVKGKPNASLHFYNGPADEDHWVSVNHFTVRRVPAGAVDWPRKLIAERAVRASDQPRSESVSLDLPGGFVLLSEAKLLVLDMKAAYEQRLFRYQDGAFGWQWQRRNSHNNVPTVSGAGIGTAPFHSASANAFRPRRIDSVQSLALEMDVVTRLEDDHGDHTLAVLLPLKPAGQIVIQFDWYGPPSESGSITDGHREYGPIQGDFGPGVFQYRIKGFRGAPPRLNLLPFLAHAREQGLSPESELLGIWLMNQVWDGSRGGTFVTKLDLIMDGIRFAANAPSK